MDQILPYLAGVLGVDQPTLLLILGIMVAASNLTVKLIPADSTGLPGLIRKVCKVLGLYVSSRVTSGVTMTDAARTVVATQPIVPKDTELKSPWFAGIIAIVVMLLMLCGCTTTQKAGVETALGTVCTSAPIAQSLYNTAIASGDHQRVNDVLNYLQLACPAVLILIQTVPVKVEVPAPPPPPAPGPERG